jgi:Fic family protein
MAKDIHWNWQQEDWPLFRYDAARLAGTEAQFLHQSGVFSGSIRHISPEDMKELAVTLISDEAMNTAEIEGEILNRDSLQSSIRRQFGLTTDPRKIPPAERGMADMRVDLYRHFATPLSDELLFRWHEMLMNGQRGLKDVGQYRTDGFPMQVVSGPVHAPKVHFEAPPSGRMASEMKRFISWFNQTGPKGKTPLPALTRAGIAHWHFVTIHPFEDGNGRVARALAEKALAQSLGQASLIALSHTINSKRKAYYKVLELTNRTNEITDWLVYFAGTVLEAQSFAQETVDFLIGKTKFFDRFRGRLNERQEKVIARVFREGPGGFKGGLSAENYLSITGTSRATATRDLQELVAMDALRKTGERKSTRYSIGHFHL